METEDNFFSSIDLMLNLQPSNGLNLTTSFNRKRQMLNLLINFNQLHYLVIKEGHRNGPLHAVL